jgi:hypothetical protein
MMAPNSNRSISFPETIPFGENPHMDYDNSLVKMTGHKLARNGYTTSQRAAFAASQSCGELNLTNLTKKQLAKVYDVSCANIRKAMTVSAMERARMRSGNMLIADIPPSAAELKRTIARAGTDRVWAEICDLL